MTNTETKKTSRRNMFLGSAAVVGAGAVSSVMLRGQTAPNTNDLNILNFALRLENLESALYSQGLATFAPKDFQNSSTIQRFGGTKVGNNIFSYLSDISKSEDDHVTKLVQTITAMGGTAQAADCYAFGFKTADDFLSIAQTLENAGVAAYDGAIAGLQNANLQTMLATIATVEARHAAYLNLLSLSVPFPSPFDTTQTMPNTLSAINQYLTTGCKPVPVQLTYAQAGPTKHAIITTSSTTVRLDASKSTSADGKALSFLWQQALGSPLFAIANDQFETATAVLMGGPGTYSVGLTVTDSGGNTDQDSLKIIYQP